MNQYTIHTSVCHLHKHTKNTHTGASVEGLDPVRPDLTHTYKHQGPAVEAGKRNLLKLTGGPPPSVNMADWFQRKHRHMCLLS